jgi:hypothetical protein
LVNNEMLGLYYAVGRYVSENSRTNSWGKGAIHQLSDSLQRELPGLRGFSDGAIKKMRLFYEEWSGVFLNRSLITNDLNGYEKNENRRLPADNSDGRENDGNRPLSMGELRTAQNSEILAKVDE